MVNEVAVAGFYCNLRCKYCYEKSEHRMYQPIKNVDSVLEKVNGTELILFGGEPLTLPISLLEELLEKLTERKLNISIQTNLVLLNDKHIELFKKYNVRVGVSIDGPNELNRLRQHFRPELTDLLTQKTIDNIKKLHKNGINVGLIITLHKVNLGSKKLMDKLVDFIIDISKYGVTSARLHSLELQDEHDKDYLLTPVEYAKLAIYIHNKVVKRNPTFSFDIIKDMFNMLSGNDNNTTCIFGGCNVLQTPSASTITDSGVYSCGRTSKYGSYIRTTNLPQFRLLLLAETPQEFGGCLDCEYFPLCKGGCPSQGLNFDFRNRDSYCELYKLLFKYTEKHMLLIGLVPVTKRRYWKTVRDLFIATVKDMQFCTANQIIRSLELQQQQNKC